MTYIQYLNQRKNFIIIWLCIHLFALFINVFNIEGVLKEGNRDCINCQTETSIHAFTDDFEKYKNDKASNFWPFTITTTYVYSNYRRHDENIFYQPESNNELKIINFNGVFNDYDYSEFMAYNFILLLIFYFKWEKDNKK